MGPPFVFDDSALRWKGCWGYVENVAFAIVLAAVIDFATHRTYNVAFLWGLGAAVGWSGRLIPVAREVLPLEALPVLLLCRIGLGYWSY